jgi:hypothetical protein
MSVPTASYAGNPYAAPVVAQPVARDLPSDVVVRSLFEQGKAGAAWFYWIAGLSVINTVMILAKAERTFALGLGLTMITDSVAADVAFKPGGNTNVLAVAVSFDAVILGLFILCGCLSQRRILPIFALGMLLYLLDGLLCLSLGLIVGVGIHAYALWSMGSGFWAYRRLNIVQRQISCSGKC